MSEGNISSREQNFWPGFVDAITNVVLVMVLVIVVFAVSMFGVTLKISKLSKEKIAQAEEKVVQQALANNCVNEVIAEGNPSMPNRSDLPSSPVVLYGSFPNIDVSYALGVTTLDDKLFDALNNLVFKGNVEISHIKILLLASMAEPSPSEARRLAFYRVGVLRDYFVAKGIQAKNIDMRISNDESIDGRSHVNIIVGNSQ